MFCMFIICVLSLVFFFKQKTAYEMRISDWSSDVCSSDLLEAIYTYTPIIVQVPKVGSAVYAHEIQGTLKKFELSAEENSVATSEIGRASCRERVCQYV